MRSVLDILASSLSAWAVVLIVLLALLVLSIARYESSDGLAPVRFRCDTDCQSELDAIRRNRACRNYEECW